MVYLFDQLRAIQVARVLSPADELLAGSAPPFVSQSERFADPERLFEQSASAISRSRERWAQQFERSADGALSWRKAAK